MNKNQRYMNRHSKIKFRTLIQEIWFCIECSVDLIFDLHMCTTETRVFVGFS